jgi:hypothetical protein
MHLRELKEHWKYHAAGITAGLCVFALAAVFKTHTLNDETDLDKLNIIEPPSVTEPQ